MSAAISIAKAASVTGQVFAISPDGKVRPLHPGDPLFPGEKVVTARDAQAVVKLADGREISLERSESLQLDGDVAGNSSQDDSAVAANSPGARELTAALAANRPLDDLLDEEATAAGESGAASEGGHNFVQFQRIVESIGSSDSAYRFGAGDRYALAERQNGDLTPAEPDTTPPNGGAAPTVTIVEDANNDGFINRAELQGDVDIRVAFDGKLVDIGDTVRVNANGLIIDVVVNAQDKANGYVSLSVPPTAHGSTLTVEAVILDPAGNSTLPGQDSAKVDTSNLQGLAVTIVEDANNDGFINKAELSGKVDIRIDLPPETIAGDLLTVRVTGNATRSIVLSQADIDAHHVLIDVDAPANGTRIEVSAQVSDPAGNLSNTAGDSATLMIGDLAAPTVTITEDANGDGWLNAAELQGNVDVRVDLPDSARAGDSLLVSVNGVARLPVLLTAADIAAGHVALAGIASPGDGHTLTVVAQLRDPAGNLSPSGSDAVTVDTTVYKNLAVEITEDRNDDGFISIAELQGNDIDVRVTLPAGAAVGDSLTVSGSGNVDQVITLTAAHLAAGHVDLKFNPTADNTDFVATARITDIAGNAAGPVSDSARLLLSEPGAPIVAITEDADNNRWISAAELNGEIDVSITLPGTARVGDSLLVSINGVAQAPHVLTLADINRGSIALAVANPGEGQSLEVTAQVRDPAGNLGKTGSDSATVDTIPPNGGKAPTVTITEDADNNGYINAAELNGDVDVKIAFDPAKVDAGDIVVVSSGTITREITVTAADLTKGYVTTAFAAPPSGDSIVVSARIVDPAGNSTPPGSDSAIVDTDAPNKGEAPTVTIAEDANNDGFINRAEAQGTADVRIDFKPALVEVGDIVRVTDGNTTREIVIDAASKAAGHVLTDFSIPAPGNTLVVTASIVDPAGNSTLPGQDSAKVDTSNLQGLAVSIVEDANNDGFINRAELSGKVDIRIDLPAEAIAGDLLTVRVTGNATRSIVLTQADIDAQHVMIDVDAPANGTRIEVSAQVSDPAGNLSNTASDSATLMIGDLAAPTVTITEDANGDGWLNAAELQGDVDVRVDLPDSARAGDSLLVSVNGVARAPVLLTAADIAAGHIDLAGIASPGDGHTLTVTAQLRDPAGNLSPSGSDAVTVDTTVFTGLAIEIAEDRNNDGFISIAELQGNDIDVRVTLPAGAAVGDSLTVSGSGNVDQVITLTTAHLAAGHVDLKFNPTADNTDFVATARITDIAGNAAGPVSDSARLLLSEPGAPLVAITEDADNNGWINAAELNGDIDVSITLPGTARVGDSLLVSINGVAQAPHVLTLADINRGSIALAVANPGEGQSLEVTAQVRDPAGNLGKIGSDSATVDTIPPNGGKAPTVTITEDADNNGYINAAELNGDVDVQIAFDPAKVDAGDIVVVSSGTITREITVTSADLSRGYVTTAFTAPPSGDSIAVSARIVDPAGNSTPPGSDSAIVDTDVPNKGDAPTVTIVEDANNDGFINRAEAQGTADVRIDFKPALVEVGDIVRVTDGSTTREIVIDAASKAAGHVLTDFPIPAPGNTLVVSATIVDPAGNSTLPGQDSAKVDTSNLQGLAVTIVEDANNDGFINKAELSGKVDIRLDLPAEAIAGDLLTVRITGNATRSIVLTQADIDAQHVLIDVDAPANGTRIEVSAQVSDPAGNLSNTASDSATLMIGDLAAPTVTITEDANGDGWLNAAELQGDVDVRVDLPDTARAGDSLLVMVNGVARAPIVLTAADIAAGYLDLSGIASPGDGNTLTVTAQLRDPAGNLSPTGSDAVTVDTTVFTGLAIEIAEDRNNDGFISIAELQGNDIDVRVTLPAGAAVGDSLTVSGSGNVDQVITLTAAHLAAGHVDLKFNPTADNTDFVATARITDIAGNAAGPVSDSARLLLSEPGAPIVTITEDADNNRWISAAELNGDIDVSITLPGTARVGDSLLVSINGVAQAPLVLTLADINRGSIALAVANPGEGQEVSVSAQVRDPAGNLGKIGSDSAIVDTIPPNGGQAPTVTITEDANNDGYINAAELNGDVDVQIAFDPAKVDAGDIVIVSSGTITREITVTAADKANGYVSTAFPPQAHGTILTVEALIRDPAGNATPRGSDSAEFRTALIIDDLTVSVSEEGLAKGLPDNLGLPADTTDSAVVSGSLVVANGTPALSYCLLAPSDELCSNGVRIVWSGDGTEASPLVGRAGPLGPEVICAKVDAQGNYEIRLLQAVDHLDSSGEDIAALNFTVKASDGNQQHSATLTLNIEDDAPLARDQSFRVGDGDGADTNLMIVLDISSSMNECACVKDLAGKDLSRLDLAKLAINDLLDRYDGLGDVMVRLVIFGNDGQAIGDRWLTVDEARAALAGISVSGEASNYDAAQATASQAFADPGRIDTAQNVSYFFSDGEPTIDSSGHPFNYTGQFDPFLGDGIDQGEELAWQAFLAQHQIVSQAIGVGPRGIIIPDQLNPIAWDGSNGCNLNSNWIGDFNEMACVFADTVDGPTTLTGSLGGFGADGGHVASLSIGGYSFAYDAQTNTLTASGSSDSVTAYQFDPVARTLTLTTVQGETLRIGLCDGSFRYHVDETPVRGSHTNLQYTLVDGDGDSASGTLGFVGTGVPANVAPVAGIETGNNLLGIIGLEALDLIDLGTRTRFTALDANNDLMRVEIAYRALVNLGPYHLQASLALAAELGLHVEITNDPGLLGLVLPSSTLVITAADGGTIDNLALNELLGTVHYEQSLLDVSVLSATSITATDSHGLSSTANVGSLAEVSLIHSPDSDPRLVEGGDGADSLQAIAAGSRLYGHGGDDLLQGAGGSDLLRGGDGNDGLDGGAGIDLLIGGRGNDILIGGADSDVFRWEFGDQGTAAAPATDVIVDFNATATVGAGGDVLDLRDLLQGEFHDGSDLGNLEQYLQIETASDHTLIRINPLGDGSAPTQQVILDGVDLSAGGLHAGTAQILENLIQQGRLLVD